MPSWAHITQERNPKKSLAKTEFGEGDATKQNQGFGKELYKKGN